MKSVHTLEVKFNWQFASLKALPLVMRSPSLTSLRVCEPIPLAHLRCIFRSSAVLFKSFRSPTQHLDITHKPEQNRHEEPGRPSGVEAERKCWSPMPTELENECNRVKSQSKFVKTPTEQQCRRDALNFSHHRTTPKGMFDMTSLLCRVALYCPNLFIVYRFID